LPLIDAQVGQLKSRTLRLLGVAAPCPVTPFPRVDQDLARLALGPQYLVSTIVDTLSISLH
jgi:hypothetical protein